MHHCTIVQCVGSYMHPKISWFQVYMALCYDTKHWKALHYTAVQWSSKMLCSGSMYCSALHCTALQSTACEGFVAPIATVQYNTLKCSAVVAKVLWLPAITAHCFRPQWATPDQLVLQCHPMHSALQCINHFVCSVQCANV